MHRCAPNFCLYFGEAIASLQRMYSILGVDRAHTQRVSCVHAKIRSIRARPGRLWEVWDQHRGSLDYHFNAFLIPEAL